MNVEVNGIKTQQSNAKPPLQNRHKTNTLMEISNIVRHCMNSQVEDGKQQTGMCAKRVAIRMRRSECGDCASWVMVSMILLKQCVVDEWYIDASMDDSRVYCISRFFRYVRPATLASIVIVFVRVNIAGFAKDEDNAWVGTWTPPSIGIRWKCDASGLKVGVWMKWRNKFCNRFRRPSSDSSLRWRRRRSSSRLINSTISRDNSQSNSFTVYLICNKISTRWARDRLRRHRPL